MFCVLNDLSVRCDVRDILFYKKNKRDIAYRWCHVEIGDVDVNFNFLF